MKNRGEIESITRVRADLVRQREQYLRQFATLDINSRSKVVKSKRKILDRHIRRLNASIAGHERQISRLHTVLSY